jgi:hypothetical protein
MNFALALAENRVPGIRVDQSQFPDNVASSGRQILFREPAKQTLESIQRALEQKEPMPGLVAGLVLGSPDFQRR